MLRVYIVDDEPLARDELKYLILRSKEAEIAGESDCVDHALADIHILKPDLVFLDIELADENGLSIAKKLGELDPAPALIFATAYDEYALQAFDLNAVDYILKPFEEERICKAIEKVKKSKGIGLEQQRTTVQPIREVKGKIPVLIDERIVLLNCRDILFLESRDGKCIIKTKDMEYRVSDALVMIEKKINEGAFLRVHRSYIVNLDQITEIEPWFNSTYNLTMEDGSKVPVSRTYVKELKMLVGF
ncbi:two-component response regulator [Bacillus sp. FJAT-27916]|uniref:LytR/AlgR family response regulator transcription factor n=1 Tax=Bacillaceae TaxID=186817 RepID=UPI000670A3A3|nr:LytTR family DNA-binding domain-containing protein [Bacillus sp. FJAT-27916]KMY45717.1 two-component response regulator [Bacillus sp. FJAT-27916]